ncbi:histidinol-phosphate transaminase [Oceanicoccus sagamiensis]|uniref:Histidinol-phosphate aminotransferase n=1 Tax=Oceanicoccus sagamiensis TaxID=716816 RepID=A0A1X9N3Z8_9GAMM|nr:histidinol-phosphate transaminase [Oceanicoccus sagamiensis]ARN72890.1 histidinol-phosphate transaminase [Oceanicoccus sagamiensis]
MTSPYWSDFVQGLHPYVPGEQPKVQDLIKLNTNENPYPPSPKVLQVINDEAINALRLYPDPSNSRLKQALAKHFALNEKQICLGNGSDEILAFAFQGLLKHSKPILFPDITYGFYTVYCGLYGIDYIELPLAEDFSINLADYQRDNGGVIFPNPNAPTGVGKSLDSIESLLKTNTNSVVIVDEAYVDFGSESAASLLESYPNLLVIQTLSKSRSLAGSRVGYALGHADLIEALERIKNSFNPYSIDRLAELAATASIEDVDYFNDCCQKIITTREWTVQQLQALGFDILPSMTNFVMAKPNSISAEALFTQLREHKILVRYFQKPRIEEYLRISIGTDKEMQALVTAIKSIL